MRQPGEITESKNGMMEITFCRPEACASCKACEGGKKEHKIRVRGEGRVGDIAIVDMPDAMIVKASAVAYGIPLIGLLAGMAAGYTMSGGKDLFSMIGAAAGLAVSLAVLKITEKRRAGKEEWNPRIVEILEKGSQTDMQTE